MAISNENGAAISFRSVREVAYGGNVNGAEAQFLNNIVSGAIHEGQGIANKHDKDRGGMSI